MGDLLDPNTEGKQITVELKPVYEGRTQVEEHDQKCIAGCFLNLYSRISIATIQYTYFIVTGLLLCIYFEKLGFRLRIPTKDKGWIWIK